MRSPLSFLVNVKFLPSLIGFLPGGFEFGCPNDLNSGSGNLSAGILPVRLSNRCAAKSIKRELSSCGDLH